MDIPLFQYKWVNLSSGVEIDWRYGMTTVDLKNLAYRTEPFVLANDVAQVFYVKDMSSRPKKEKISKLVHHTMSQSAT